MEWSTTKLDSQWQRDITNSYFYIMCMNISEKGNKNANRDDLGKNDAIKLYYAIYLNRRQRIVGRGKLREESTNISGCIQVQESDRKKMEMGIETPWKYDRKTTEQKKKTG